MLDGLFKPAWQSPSVTKRLGAIEKLDSNASQDLETLEKLAKDDPKLEVRKAAIEKIPLAAVFSILSSHKDDETREQARAVISDSAGRSSPISEQEYRELISQQPDAASWMIRLCPVAEIRNELVSQLPESTLIEALGDIEFAETRKLIAEHLQTLESLEQARKTLKGKDKSAERIIKSKIDALREQEKQERENREFAEDLCEKMEYLASKSSSKEEWLAEFGRKYHACCNQWNALNFQTDTTVQNRYKSAFETVSAWVEQQERIAKTQISQVALANDLETYCCELADVSLTDMVVKRETIANRAATYIASWQELGEIERADLNAADQFFKAEGALKSLFYFLDSTQKPDAGLSQDLETEATDIAHQVARLDKALSSLKWPSAYPELNAKNEIASKLAELRTQRKLDQKTQKESLDKLHKRINRILGSAKRGELPRANRELESAKTAAQQFSGKEKSALDTRIENAEEAIGKMGDWKDFATEPKYIELCEAMEALVGSDLHPDQLAQEIQKLQQQWKALGYSESSDTHWERFKSAGDQAYTPCSTFFSERRSKREANLAEREKLVSRVQDLLSDTDWDAQPDYKQIESEMRQLMNDWKKIKDVEQGPGQKQWNRFSVLRKEINAKFDVVYDANIELKNGVIEQAKTLADSEIKEESLTQLQLLQTRWKQIGITRRKDDQTAWKEFKSVTDGIYEKIQGVRQEKRDVENEQLDGYRNITKRIRSLAKDAKDLAESDHLFEQLQSQYQKLPPLPKGLSEDLIANLDKDYQRACDAYAKSRDRMLDASSKEELQALVEKARLCCELEKLAESKDEDQINQLKSDIDEIEIRDRKLQSLFQQRLDTALDADKSEAGEHRRLLCIELEILLEKESPKEDREQRMTIQFDRMKEQGLGTANIDKTAEIEERKRQWLCMPGAEPKLQQKLEKRFNALF